MDEKARARLDEAIADARMLLIPRAQVDRRFPGTEGRVLCQGLAGEDQGGPDR